MLIAASSIERPPSAPDVVSAGADVGAAVDAGAGAAANAGVGVSVLELGLPHASPGAPSA